MARKRVSSVEEYLLSEALFFFSEKIKSITVVPKSSDLTKNKLKDPKKI
jgi:uncharacterized protein YnzC (UPF0291/DUF896 family)